MKKNALFHNDPFSEGGKAVRSLFFRSNEERAFFRQNRVSVLTKIQCTLLLMSLTSNQCGRPAL